MNVNVTESIEPDLPLGNSGICGPDEVSIYEVSFQTAGRTYTWFVTGGNLISGQNSPRVEVLWNLSSPSKTIYFEEKSTINGACSGTSEILEVIVYPEFEIGIADVLNPACPGESNGRIQLNPSGGSGSYGFSWSHDLNLKSALAPNLPSGTYEVSVSDATGCAVEELSFSLTEPEELRVEAPVQVIANSCFGVADGEFLINRSVVIHLLRLKEWSRSGTDWICVFWA